MTTATYETDFYLWTQQQAALLRQGQLSALDVENLAEEIDDMGASRERELENRLAVLLAHLLKWIVQPERRGNSWRLTILEQRRRLARLLEKSEPSRALIHNRSRCLWRCDPDCGAGNGQIRN